MNDSSEGSTYDYDDYGFYYDYRICNNAELNRFDSIATPVIFSVVTALSLIGNILVLVILVLYEDLKSLTNMFIFNLAVSDLVFTSALPFWIANYIWGWIFGEITCKIVSFIYSVGFYSSGLFLTIMTIHRYLGVVHPLSVHRTQRASYRLALALTLWVASIGAAVPALILSSVIEYEHGDFCGYENRFWHTISTYQTNILFLVEFAVMSFCYVRILGKIMRRRYGTKNRTVKLIFCIVVVFFVSWTPYNVVSFIYTLDASLLYECEVSILLDYVFCVSRFIAFSHCCLNPVFYAFVGVKFRNHLKTIWHKVLGR